MSNAIQRITVDGNEAAALVAHRLSEIIAVYPITPSSTMAELADEWSAKGRTNLWGQVPDVVEMQSEAGAAGAVHGALQSGALATTFTASQGLLLMIPNMYKIAGELTPFVMHVTARAVATHALSIFGDHSDVMGCRQTGFAMLASGSVQEAHDMAAIAHAATLRSRVPFVHFFDGFRTSHEVSKIVPLTDDQLRAMIDAQDTQAHRQRALSPDHPVLRGTAQNPDVFFQAREAINSYYDACPGLVQAAMARFAELTGRSYRLFDYVGHPQAQRVVVMMGSGAEVAHEAVDHLVAAGQRVGLLKVRLYRPFAVGAFLAALPPSVRQIAVLDRTKEPGALGEPLYLDVAGALREGRQAGLPVPEQEVQLIGGRYGLGSKEFTPAMVKAVFDELALPAPRQHFTVGIRDDVTHLSLPVDESFSTESNDVFRALFFGLGADGTVGANKNSIKIIGEETENFAQGYFVYDSKKSGAVTVSHLRFGPRLIRSSYLISHAHFVACHQFPFLGQLDVLEYAAPGAVFLLNAHYPAEQVWDHLPARVQRQIVDKKLRFYAIDAAGVAQATGMGGRINTIMQTCFFAISGVLPREEAIERIKAAIAKTYGKRGPEVVQRNFAAVDATLAHLHEVHPGAVTGATGGLSASALQGSVEDIGGQAASGTPTCGGCGNGNGHGCALSKAPQFVQNVTMPILQGKGDRLPVSAFPVDGTWPMGTSQYEKRRIALEIPEWDEKLCIQCNKCALVCPHAAIRPKVYEASNLVDQPAGFRWADYKAPDLRGLKYTLQVAPEDCTGCTLCVTVCPVRDKADPEHRAVNMRPIDELLPVERPNFEYFLELPEVDRTRLARIDAKSSQLMQPLFEYSGACSGCGETPYVKLLTQLFGDRSMIANATGCSSIYGGNLPTTPYTTNRQGRGPAWCNSLFEDNAEFGLGFRVTIDHRTREARDLLQRLGSVLGDELTRAILDADQSSEAGIIQQRRRVEALALKLAQIDDPTARQLAQVVEFLVKKSVWILGGDGWAYDIGYGGLDHVLASGHKVNVLVMDTEVYSNTGGQQSKATPLGAVARFAAGGKRLGKKDLGWMAMAYGHVYVAAIAMGANDNHTVKTFLEAEAYPGPSLIIAYSHCIAHGYDLRDGLEQQKLAVDSGLWPLYRFDPRRVEKGEPALQMDSKTPKPELIAKYWNTEARFRNVASDPAVLAEARRIVLQRWARYQHMATLRLPIEEAPREMAPDAAPAGVSA